MTKEILKEKACAAIDAYADKIKAICASINDEPELGFKEVKTAAKVTEFMRDLGLQPETGLAINGVKGRAKGGKPGPTAAVLGELDAVGCPTSPKADPATGAAHACGHNLQISTMLAAACGISLVLSHWLKPASTGIASAHTNKIQLCALKFSTIAVIGELEIFDPRK